jgi:hypothetical protein
MTSWKKLQYPSSVYAVERGQQTFRRALGTWTNYTSQMLSATGALASSDDYTLFNWTWTAGLMTTEAVCDTFEAYASLWYCPPSQKQVQIQFDPNAEMAGPGFLELDSPPHDLPEASSLAGPIEIPEELVIVRVQGTTLAVTLVNLKFAERHPIPAGEYKGTIRVDGEQYPVVALCSDQPTNPYRKQIIQFLRTIIDEVGNP